MAALPIFFTSSLSLPALATFAMYLRGIRPGAKLAPLIGNNTPVFGLSTRASKVESGNFHRHLVSSAPFP